MDGGTFEDNEAGGNSSLIEGMSSDQRSQSGDSLAEWRSCEQVENGTPSTSPPFWDTGDDDDDNGLKPSELHGKYTWKIDKFSEINKRELRSSAFEVGGYKWYILIYPQGCDVSNHLSLFLCVANHDKLLPGWSHFAQFTIAVVNKDPKKSKHSDTLHRFWKKEHDWGWKKFMELSKVADGFIVGDTVVIKAQVQVIREKAHRLFRCLDRQYRRELVRVYLSNVEQICRRFVEERRGKLSKLIEDRMRWSSFRVFWLGIDKNTRQRMSGDKTDAILKVVVKHFFIEKEVTSTLVMDSLYSGLKALEYQSKNEEEREKLVDVDELPAPMVRIEKDMFVLADDVLVLLERAVLEPLPHQPLPPKDDKASQNRTKDVSSGEELNKDYIERDERRLTELGRRTVEIFVLAHIFSSRIEVAYQEAVALKRQEELIREEEAAGQIENELKARRAAAEKEKRTKKKQGKQKRNNRKVKDRGRDEKSDVTTQDKHQPESSSGGRILGLSSTQAYPETEKVGGLIDASDVSDTGDDVPELLHPELEDRDSSPINWDTDTPEIHPVVEARGSETQNGQIEKTTQSVIDDSCSTCSTDSVPSVVMNGPYKGNSLPNNKSQTSLIREKDQHSKHTHDQNGFTHEGSNSPSDVDATIDAARLCEDSASSRDSQPEPETVASSLNDQIQRPEQHLVEKAEAILPQKKSVGRDEGEGERPTKSRAAESSSSPSSPGKKPPLSSPQPTNRFSEIKSSETSSSKSEKPVPLAARSSSKSEVQKHTRSIAVPPMSRPSSAPLIPSLRPTVPIAPTVQTMPLLSRSMSAAGRLGNEQPSPSASSYFPQSYRSITMGSSRITPPTSTSSSQQPVAYSGSSLRPGFTFGSINPEALHSWRGDDYSYQEASSSSYSNPNLGKSRARPYLGQGTVPQGAVPEEFPHLDIINDLLDEDPNIGKASSHHPHPPFSRQYSFPDVGSYAEQYYSGGMYGSSSNGSLSHPMRDAHVAAQNQWPYQHADVAMLNSDPEGYHYQLQEEYLNSMYGRNGGGYGYRSASGH